MLGLVREYLPQILRSARREEASESIDDLMESRFRTDGHWQRPPRAADMAAHEREVREHLADCLEGDSTDQRMAFILGEVEELTSDEICKGRRGAG